MSMAVAAVLAVAVSTAARQSPSGDASWSAAAPSGYTLIPSTAPSTLRALDAAGDLAALTALGPSTPVQLDAAAYDELKALEIRLASPGKECVSGPLRDLELSPGRTARGAEGVCGPGGRAYAVAVSSVGGRMFLASSEGRSAAAAEFLAGAAAVEVGAFFPILAKEPFAPLAPLPPRAHRTQYRILLFVLFAGFVAFIFVLRALPGLLARFFPDPVEPPGAPGSDYPVVARRVYGRLVFLFETEFETGARFTAVSDRKPSVMISWGSTLLAAYLVQSAAGADSLLRGQTLFASLLLLVAGNLYLRRSPRKLSLLDANAHPIVEVVENELSLADPAGVILLEGEPTPYSLRRRLADGVRHWEVLDQTGAAALAFVEDSARKARARRAFGHLWGALRTEYTLTAGGRVVGGLKRTWSVWNAFRLDMVPVPGLDTRFVAAAILFIERVDPDRWHPWFA